MKKALSLILTLALLLACTPVFPLQAAAEERDSVVYQFYDSAWADKKIATETAGIKAAYDAGTSNWRYEACSKAFHFGPNGSNSFSSELESINFFCAAGTWLAVRIQSPGEGKFDLTLTHSANTKGAGSAGMYIIKADTIDAALGRLAPLYAQQMSADPYQENGTTLAFMSYVSAIEGAYYGTKPVMQFSCYATSVTKNLESVGSYTFEGDSEYVLVFKSETLSPDMSGSLFMSALTTTLAEEQAGTGDAPSVIASGICGKDLTWTLDHTGNLIISGTGPMSPSPWNEYSPRIENVIIPDGVTRIGDYAFQNCINLTSIVIPESVTSIGKSAFDGCSNLKTVHFNATNCIVMGTYQEPVFSDCTGLKTILLGENVSYIPSYAFHTCSSLTSIQIPTSVTTIENGAFRGCSGLENVYYAGTQFKWDQITISVDNEALTNATIHVQKSEPVASGVTGALTWTLDEQGTLVISGTGTMPDYNYNKAPWSKKDVKKVIIEDGVTDIGYGAFFNCANIVSVEIGNTVTTIGGDAFYGCTSLTNITLPDSLTTLKDAAFFYSGLTSIVIPDSVTAMGRSVFMNCPELESVVIGCGVTKLDYYTFQGCEKLTTVTLPTSVTDIFEDAFKDCRALTTVYYPGTRAQAAQISVGSSNYHLIGADWIYDEAATEETVVYSGTCGANVTWELGEFGTLTISGTGAMDNYSYPSQVPWNSYRKNIRRVVIEDGVTTLPRYAFHECFHLSSVKLPKSLTALDIYAFAYCYCLHSIVIPDGVTLLDNYAFLCCESLTEVTLPGSVTSIGSDAFWFCNLAAVYYGGTEEQKANITIDSDNDSLLNATWYYEATPCYYIANSGEKTICPSLEDALYQADGGTVQLMVDATVDTAVLKPGVTLDLNGCTLTADLFVAMDGAVVTDGDACSGGGVLKIAKDNLALSKDNGGVVPVWNGVDGYVFTKVTYQQMAKTAGEGAVQYIFLPTLSNADAAALMADGGVDNGLKIKVGLEWSNGQCQQFYTYSDDLVKQVFESGGKLVFSLTVTGIAGIEDMTANAIVVTDSGTQAINTSTAIKAG